MWYWDLFVELLNCVDVLAVESTRGLYNGEGVAGIRAEGARGAARTGMVMRAMPSCWLPAAELPGSAQPEGLLAAVARVVWQRPSGGQWL